MQIQKHGQALFSWLCIFRLVDADGDLIAVWSWDSPVRYAFHLDPGLEVPALHHMPAFHAVLCVCMAYLSHLQLHDCVAAGRSMLTAHAVSLQVHSTNSVMTYDKG